MFSLLLFFVAAMSVQTAQAQSNGDVNGDGVVDEKDITAILKIMAEAGGVKKKAKYYWYVGQEAVTVDNYTTLATQTSEKLTSKEYKTEKFGRLYILTPESVISIKIKDVNMNLYVSESKYSQDNSFVVDGYKLWVTSAFGANAPQIIEYIY